MIKVDKLFVDYPELKVLEIWMRKQLQVKGKNVVKNLFRNYRIRKPKKFDEMIHILKTSNDSIKLFGASLYLEAKYCGNSYFSYINKCFSKLKDKKSFKGYIKRLISQPEKFNDILSEIEFNAYFSKRYPLNPEPKIGTKKLDSSIELDKREVLFEIFTPNAYKPLEEAKGKVIQIPNTSKSKILDKLQDQIIPIKDLIKQPVIIVINGTSSVIDEYDIADSLFGQLKLVLIKDSTGKVIYDYEERDMNSISDKESLANLITGVLFYRRNIYLNKIEFRKELILNKNPKYPLTIKEIKKLNRFDLNKIVSNKSFH